ncbi:MAG: DNA polymerase III subunit beta [Rhodothermales bacterium]|nr:DNA polymerase III subunit beta [Rhodothermales bacterium]
MKFTASTADLLKALTTVSGAVPSKSTLPILECVLLEQSGESLRISATDLEISIVKDLPVQFESNGTSKDTRVAVPAKRFLDTLRALPEIPIEFSSDAEFAVTLKTDQGVYKMVGHDGADYPSIPELEDGITIVTPGAVLRRAIQKTSFAVSKDALRPAMMGIYFQIQESRGRAVATDGHRLVKLTMTEMTSKENIDFIVPEKAMNLAGKIVTNEDCTITIETGYIGMDFGGARVLARKIDEAYPNYEAVIPIENDRKLTVNRLSMLAAVKRVGLYSSSMTNQVRLSLQPDQVEIHAEDLERSSEAHETVLAEYEGEEMVIGFNSVYLTEVLSNIDTDDVVFEFSSPNRAGVVTPATQDKGEQILMLIMPVMLNTYA